MHERWEKKKDQIDGENFMVTEASQFKIIEIHSRYVCCFDKRNVITLNYMRHINRVNCASSALSLALMKQNN